MDDRLKNINPQNLTKDENIRQVLTFLLNVVEDQASVIEQQRQVIQELKDELNRLKGEQGRPNIKGQTTKEDYSSQSRELRKKNHKKGPKKARIIIDREKLVDFPAGKPVADAKLKYYEELIQQDVRLERTNICYRIAVYYSPSLKKIFRPEMPAEYSGPFGASLKGLLHLLYYGCDVTQGRLRALMAHLGISISTGQIDRILKSQEQWACQEQAAILQAGIASSPYTQTDTTGNREKGRNKWTHIICAEFFSTFHTLDGKSRLDVLHALQGNAAEGLGLSYNKHTRALLKAMDVSSLDRQQLGKYFAGGKVYSLQAFKRLVARRMPPLVYKKNIFPRVLDAFALGHYFDQNQWPVVDVLLTDDAREYKKLARQANALCWVHDARPYNKLAPRLTYHRKILDGFREKYWEFYYQLLDFKELPPAQQQRRKTYLRTKFKRLFGQTTHYAQLDPLLKGTLANKAELLQVLNHPALPLHNNAAELAARRMVRKRDVSFHTMSAQGTRVRDAFLTIVETAARVGVNALDYIIDRITGQFKMTPLALSVKQAYL